MKMIIESPNEQIDLELVALGVNLALNSKCAIQMIEYNKKKGLKLLVKRAFKFKDSLVMKMVRNISQHDEVKKYFCVSYLSYFRMSYFFSVQKLIKILGICRIIWRNYFRRKKSRFLNWSSWYFR